MAKKSRPSVQKREREQKKRQRDQMKAEKAAEKRRRKFDHAQQALSPPPEVIDGASKADPVDNVEPQPRT